MRGTARSLFAFALTLATACASAAQPAIPKALLDHLRSEKAREIEGDEEDVKFIDGYPTTQESTGTFLLMTLETLNEESLLLPTDPRAVDFAAPYTEYINLDPELRLSADLHSLGIPLPRADVDHSHAQTPIRYQGLRPTCVAHAALAAMEAQLGIAKLDLSEDLAHHRFMKAQGAHCCRPVKPGTSKPVEVNTLNGAGVLKTTEVPLDQGEPWAYNVRWPICSGVSTGCYLPVHDEEPVAHPTYRLTDFEPISGKTGLRGPSIKNTAYLEVLLAAGHDVVIAMGKAWQKGDETGIIDVKIVGGAPRKEGGGHAMLLVGYDRSAGYFIAKNSMGDGWGFAGYAHLSYAYLATYARYGFFVKSVAVTP